MSEVAGRLEIEVTSDTKGFGAALKRKLEAITKEVVAEVRATIDTDGMKADLETGVKKAAEGVEAKIGVSLKDRAEVTLRAQLERVARVASEGVNASLGVKVNEKDRKSLGELIKDRKRRLRVDAEVDKKGLLRSWLEARAAVGAAAKRKPIELPFVPATGRGAFMPLFYAGIASLIQPLIGTIGGALGGLASMAANLSNAIGVLAAAPTVLAGAVGGFLALKSVVSALGGSLKKMPEDVREVAKTFRDAGKDLKKSFKENAQDFITRNAHDLKHLADVLPLVSEAQGQLLKSTDKATKSLSEWVRSKAFSAQFRSVSKDASGVWSAGSQALVGWAKGLLNIADAATPLVNRISAFIKRTGEWASGIAAPGKKAKEFGDWLKYAGDKASQMWRVLKDLGAGIAGVFRAGRDTGDGLLKTLEDSVAKWREWVESADGQNKIKLWFEEIEPIAREAGGLIKDVVLALVRMSQDKNIASMLRSIRKELLPTLERFFTTLGKTLGPSVIGLIQNLLEVLTEMSDAGSPISRGIGFISDALGGLAAFFRNNPKIATTVGVLLGGLMAYRALAFIGKATGLIQLFDILNRRLGGGGMTTLVGGFGLVIASLSGSLSGLPGPASGAAAALGTFMLLQGRIPAMTSALDSMRLQLMYLRDAQQAKGGGFTGLVRAIGGSGGAGLRGALGGLKGLIGGALGGPVGIGLAVVSGAVGVWAQKHAETAAAAQAYKGYVDQIVTSLEAESGALTQATRDVIAKKLMDDGLAASATKYGIALEDLTDATLDNADAQGRIAGALRVSANEVAQAHPRYKDLAGRLKDVGLSQDAFSAALINGGPAWAAMKAQILEGTSGNHVLNQSLTDLLDQVYDNTKGQRDFADGLGKTAQGTKDAQREFEILNQLTGKTREQVAGVITKIKEYKGQSPANVTVAALTKTAEARLKDMGYTVRHLPDGRIVITADTSRAESQAKYASRTRYGTIMYRVRTAGGPTYTGGGGQADGSILSFSKFADGGFHSLADMARNRFKSFANGVEKHVAQIARPGDWRVWAEPETGGEAYIPLAGSKRTRSTAILREVANQFGYALAPQMSSLTRGLTGVHRAIPTTSPSAPAAPSAMGFGLGGSAAERLVIQLAQGAVQITNPAPEPAGKSVVDSLREVGEFGLNGA